MGFFITRSGRITLEYPSKAPNILLLVVDDGSAKPGQVRKEAAVGVCVGSSPVIF